MLFHLMGSGGKRCSWGGREKTNAPTEPVKQSCTFPEKIASHIPLDLFDQPDHRFVFFKRPAGNLPALQDAEEIGDLVHIGVFDNVVAIARIDNEGSYMVMFNPEIIKKSGPYEAEEGCLSLAGIRKAKRWRSIKVQYQNEKFQTRFKSFTGWTAQIIQHEIDHCEGILI